MKNVLLLFSFFFLSITSLCADDVPPFNPNGSNQFLLLTYPRSGTNLTSCYVQALTGRPIRWIDQKGPTITDNRLGLEIDFSKPVLFRDHGEYPILTLHKNSNKLLFLLRNYREAIRRQQIANKSTQEFYSLFSQNELIVRRYFNNLKTYDAWDRKNSLIIYYEDLLTDPVTEMRKVLDFFGEEIPPTLTVEFLHDISQRTLESYHEQHIDDGGSQSRGADLEFHTKQMPKETVAKVDEFVRKTYPRLWNRYLKRYEYQPTHAK